MARLIFALQFVTSILAAAVAPAQNASADSYGNTPASDADVQRIATTTNNCCSILKELRGLSTQTFVNDAQYSGSLQSYWSAQEQAVKPGCVFIPQDVTSAARGIAVLSAASKYIRGGCSFAIRGGGHTPFAGSANIQSGVTIDTQALSKISLSSDQQSVSIGPGNKWGEVYSLLDAHGLSTSGGRVASVGVGGLTLGGGISFFSPRYGFVCDNVINYEVITAAGKVLNVNARSYPDLFKTLKGGSNNFGLVTRFDMKVFKQGPFLGGFLVNPIQVADAFYSLFENFAKSKSYDPYSALIASFSYNNTLGAWFIASNLEYTKPVQEPAVFKPFLQLPKAVSTLRISTLTDFTTEIAANTPPGIRDAFATATFKNSAPMMKAFVDIANHTLAPIAQSRGFSFTLSFQPLPQAITSAGAATTAGTGNSLGLGPEAGDLVNALLTVQWGNQQDDAAIDRATRQLFTLAEQEAKQRGVYHPYLYLNYAAQWQKPIQGYGSQSVAFLKQVSAKYDPKGVFQKLVPGGFKLPN